MIVEFRQAVSEVLGSISDLPVYDQVPGAINEMPCIVVGRPDVAESDTPTVYDIALDAYLIGPNLDAGGSSSDALDELADTVLVTLGGSGAVTEGDVTLYASDMESAIIEVAGHSFPAYNITIESSARIC